MEKPISIYHKKEDKDGVQFPCHYRLVAITEDVGFMFDLKTRADMARIFTTTICGKWYDNDNLTCLIKSRNTETGDLCKIDGFLYQYTNCKTGIKRFK